MRPFIYFFAFLFTCASFAADTSSKSTPFNEKHRPQMHFSPAKNWMNDPNGMFYYQGKYHLFYQHNPDWNTWGPMHWGHATSTDLVHWQHQPIALYPDEHGRIYSGSAVVDWNNTSGLGTKNNPPIVAIFTYHNTKKEKAGAIDIETQGIAYSVDSGKTWTKYTGNPVLPNPGIRHYRDPKVFWHSATKKWIMAITLGDKIGIYSSPNLISWQQESTFSAGWSSTYGMWECPDLIRVPIEGTKKYRYVLLTSVFQGAPNGGNGTQYFVGDFDGKTFIQDPSQTTAKWIDYGTDNYAGVTFSDIPETDGRTVFMGWMSNWQYANNVPTQTWRSAMTIPRELILDPKDLTLLSKPVAELNKLTASSTTKKKLAGKNIYDLFSAENTANHPKRLKFKVSPDDNNKLSLTLKNQQSEHLTLELDFQKGVLRLDRRQSGITDFKPSFAKVLTAPIAADKLRYDFDLIVDRASIEIFVDGGKTVLTSIFFSNAPLNNIQIKGEQIFELTDVQVETLNSIW